MRLNCKVNIGVCNNLVTKVNIGTRTLILVSFDKYWWCYFIGNVFKWLKAN